MTRTNVQADHDAWRARKLAEVDFFTKKAREHELEARRLRAMIDAIRAQLDAVPVTP